MAKDKRLIVPTLYKAFLSSVCAGIFNVMESLIGSFIYGKGPLEAVDNLLIQFNYELLAGGFVVFFAFIPFFTIRELTPVLGEGTLFKLFFQSRSAVEPGADEAQNRQDSADSLVK